MTREDFWKGVVNFGVQVGVEFLRGFALALGGMITYYATEKLGKSLLPPPNVNRTPTAVNPQPPVPTSPPAYYGQHPPRTQEVFPGFVRN